MEIRTENFVEIAEREMKDDLSRDFLKFLPPVLKIMRETAMGSLADPEQALKRCAGIRERSVAQLKTLLKRFETRAEEKGARVFWAKNAREANKYISDLARKNKVPFVAKGKSMLTEEMGLNRHLISEGIGVYETDLGEFIAQLMELPPFHIVGPVVNVPVARISEAFLERGIIHEPTEDPASLGQAAREYLRARFRDLKMGITGVNMAVAETGSIINVENEGNIRMCKSSPEIQVSVMSLEKVIPTMSDAAHQLRMLCRCATGQKLTSYVTVDSGPAGKDCPDGPRELHIVILDNGRSAVHGNVNTREVLRCIRCGACINVCPVFGVTGGYPYGWAYTGPIGAILSPLLLGLSRTNHLFGACTQCGACAKACPAGIDHPGVIRHLRRMNNIKGGAMEGAGAPWARRLFFKGLAGSARRPGVWRIAGYAASRGMGAAPLLRNIGPAKGWLSCRDFPVIPEESFRQIWKTRGGKV